MKSKRYHIVKDNKNGKVWWVDEGSGVGEFLFTFDKKKFFNLFADYPSKLSVEDWIAFNDENEYWAGFFKDRNEKYVAKHIDEIEKLGRGDMIKKIISISENAL